MAANRTSSMLHCAASLLCHAIQLSDGDELVQQIHLLLECWVPHRHHLRLQVRQEGCVGRGGGPAAHKAGSGNLSAQWLSVNESAVLPSF